MGWQERYSFLGGGGSLVVSEVCTLRNITEIFLSLFKRMKNQSGP